MKLVLFANTDWYLYNFRSALALALKAAGHEVLLISPSGPYGERLRQLGLRWHALPMQRSSLNPFRELGLLVYLWRLLRREQPDILHSFTIKCAVYGSLVGRLAGVPGRVNAVAGMGYVFSSNEPKARLLRPVVRALLRMALGGHGARLILQNQDDLQWFADTGLSDATPTTLIMGSGVDFSRYQPGNAPRAPGPMRVLLAARLLWDKGIAEYVAAATLLHAEGKTIRFLLAGDPDPGNPAAVPEATLRQWVAEGRIEWLGHVDDMPALLGCADVFVLPSYREGCPKGLIEAAACALPLITTDVPGCRAVVSDGIDGLLVPARDAPALAQAIARMQDDPVLASRLGNAAREKALGNFGERQVIAATMAVYQSLSASVD